jgi:hypothetical protein
MPENRVTMDSRLSAQRMTGTERRYECRLQIEMKGTCRTKLGRRSPAVITELSIHGCRLQGGARMLTPDEIVLIKLDNRDFLEARVAWTDRDTAGLNWTRALHPAIVDHIFAFHGRGGGSGVIPK